MLLSCFLLIYIIYFIDKSFKFLINEQYNEMKKICFDFVLRSEKNKYSWI